MADVGRGSGRTSSDGGPRAAREQPAWLTDIVFVGPLQGWISGSQGFLTMTTDGGRNWIQVNCGTTWEFQTSATTVNLYDVHFLDEDVGWIVGDVGTILKTTTGGRPLDQSSHSRTPN
jgi:photosystem II stability/assembly factor-like uncharacterized protein